MKPILTALTALVAIAPLADAQGVVALRVGRAETIANGTLEHAVILVENGVITAVGQDLPVERGIPIVDLPDAVVMPGLVNCRSRIGLDSRGAGGAELTARASAELFPDAETWEELLERGVTTLGLYPPGNGIPGLAVAVRPHGDTAAAMIVKDPAYLQMYLRADRGSKKLFTDAFEKLDKYLEKVEKEREKFEKDGAKGKKDDKKDDAKKEEPKKDDAKKDTALALQEDKKDEKKDDKKGEKAFQPSQPDDDVRPMLDLVTGRLRAVIGIRKAADWLHLLDVLGEREFEFDLQCDMRDDLDLFEVMDEIGERKLRVILDASVTQHPGTRRERNLPAELVEAGAKVAFSPRADTVRGHEEWLRETAELVRYGLDRQVALRALTLEPAHVLGLGDKLGSIEVGRAANLLIFDRDPLDPAAKLDGVMLDGRFVAGERFEEAGSPVRGGFGL